ncbi:mechanosensitive ion channel protein MscS [Vibrio navarrensis]|uniref:Mechanosensitive ion channel family protein n=1 Tax=Vibrio navarrensis TaxID=29495 RepID=A0AAJ4IFE8_9VIBR|nr:mechanosensitive ion channel family protein [Vibrio navarrensis]MBE3652332.1 mechanosensitive ion channel protein MscS [Vibrio navarrensis]MBE3657129.1 mechanosensitive ion channel protein MscS [Vibrio navarrensis]MBE3662401.1 mechanosensitive ion channel protein MscS [Vibrio navarrensis]MBE3671010.1 mechanosensitive ion channel protein MscS [Vibrio navarrensis]MBE4605741.1 mechanosensitive ion channel protein MscS [Vibrio navarrensis]
MNDWLLELQRALFSNHQDWFGSVLLITIGSGVAWLIWRLVVSRLRLLASKTRLHWDDILVESIQTPISTLIWLWPATLSLAIAVQSQTGKQLAWLGMTKRLLLIALFVWIVIRLISRIEDYILAQANHDETTVQAIAKVSRLFFLAIAMLTMMQAFGLSLSGLLTFGGVGGLIVGLAAKDLLSNFFGGLMIYFDRPFKVGDWIRSPDRQIEGTVERIGWRMTSIRTFEKRPLYVPNSVFSNIVVENPSRMLNRRINETIGVRYDDNQKLPIIIEQVRKMLEQHPDIDVTQTLIVNFNTFGPSSLNFFIYTFTKTVNWVEYHSVKQDVLLKVMEIIQQNGADIAFPTQTIKLDPFQAGISSTEKA